MSNYTKTTDFEAKDSLPSGDSGKIIRGSEFETEFDNIATAIASKSDANNPTFTGTVTIDGLTVNGNTVLGNAATDTVTVTADIASNLLPSADDTYNLGAVGAEWNDLHVDGVAYIDTIAGFATTENITFGDNDKAIFGAGSDLEIYHDGSDSFIVDQGTGNLAIRASSSLYLQSAAGSTYFQGVSGGASTLYHSGSSKLATTSTGIDVTGVITTDGMTTSADINFGDNDKAVFGAGNDLQIYHDGSDSLIKDVGSGDLNISAGNDLRLQDSSGNNYFKAGEGGASKVYYAGAEKLATTSTGIDVTGTVSSGDITITDTFPVMSLVGTTGGATWNQLVLSDGSYQIRSGTPSRLNISTGGDISFYEDTGTTPKFFWDASAERLGLGTTSPQRPLHLDIGTDNTAARFQSTDTEVALEFIDPAGTAYFRASGDYIKMGATQSDSLTILDGGNVGIGTDSPARTLDVVGDASISTTGNSTGLRITTSTTGEGYFIFGDTDDASMGGMSYSNNTNALMFDANNLERMRIDSSGALLLHPNNATRGLKITTTQTTAVGDTTTYDTLGAGHGRHVFKTDGTEAMRIDASQNVLIGTTDTAPGAGDTNTGVSFRSGGDGFFSKASSYAARFNRNTNDGDVVTFAKDGSTVGSIGSNNDGGSKLFIGSSASAVKFKTNAIVPCTDTGSNNNNDINLGENGTAFKDLYLSGGVFLGGVASQNKLDDYEEGTWTPTLVGTTSGSATVTVTAATYTKVGNMVNVRGHISADLSSHNIVGVVEIGGLPFTSSSQAGAGSTGYNSLVAGAVHLRSISSTLRLGKGDSNNWLHTDLLTGSNALMFFEATYETTS